MTFYNTEEVKQWMRDILYTRQHLRLKIQFYQNLIEDTQQGGFCFENDPIQKQIVSSAMEKIINTEIYRDKIAQLQKCLLYETELFDKMLDRMNGEERCIMTAKYLNGISWEHIEAYVPYCRRQAIRIHNKALKKLTGIDWEVNCDGKKSDRQAKSCFAGSRL